MSNRWGGGVGHGVVTSCDCRGHSASRRYTPSQLLRGYLRRSTGSYTVGRDGDSGCSTAHPPGVSVHCAFDCVSKQTTGDTEYGICELRQRDADSGFSEQCLGVLYPTDSKTERQRSNSFDRSI